MGRGGVDIGKKLKGKTPLVAPDAAPAQVEEQEEIVQTFIDPEKEEFLARLQAKHEREKTRRTEMMKAMPPSSPSPNSSQLHLFRRRVVLRPVIDESIAAATIEFRAIANQANEDSQTFEGICNERIATTMADDTEFALMVRKRAQSHASELRSLLDCFNTFVCFKFLPQRELCLQRVQDNLGNELNRIAFLHAKTLENAKRRLQTLTDHSQILHEHQEQNHRGQGEHERNIAVQKLNDLKATLRNRLESSEWRMSQLHEVYGRQNQDRTADYITMTETDEKLSLQISRGERRTTRLQSEIKVLRDELMSERVVHSQRVDALKAETKRTLEYDLELRRVMRSRRVRSHQRLVALTSDTRECREVLEAILQRAIRILAFSEKTNARQMCHDVFGRQAVEKCRIGGVDSGESSLDAFNSKLHNAVLETQTLQLEKTALLEKNLYLRNAIERFHQAVNVDRDLTLAPNPLLVVNGRHGLRKKGQYRDRRRS